MSYHWVQVIHTLLLIDCYEYNDSEGMHHGKPFLYLCILPLSYIESLLYAYVNGCVAVLPSLFHTDILLSCVQDMLEAFSVWECQETWWFQVAMTTWSEFGKFSLIG